LQYAAEYSIWGAVNTAFKGRLNTPQSLAAVKSENSFAVLFVAGQGTMWNLPENTVLKYPTRLIKPLFISALS
jgi:hypothetical protein